MLHNIYYIIEKKPVVTVTQEQNESKFHFGEEKKLSHLSCGALQIALINRSIVNGNSIKFQVHHILHPYLYAKKLTKHFIHSLQHNFHRSQPWNETSKFSKNSHVLRHFYIQNCDISENRRFGRYKSMVRSDLVGGGLLKCMHLMHAYDFAFINHLVIFK